MGLVTLSSYIVTKGSIKITDTAAALSLAELNEERIIAVTVCTGIERCIYSTPRSKNILSIHYGITSLIKTYNVLIKTFNIIN